jgi:cyclic lactone autoinducer peptide
MKKLSTLMMTSLAAMLFFVATVGAIKPFCSIQLYEPDIPKALKQQ